MLVEVTKVQVATPVVADPLPGIISETPWGDIIIVHETATNKIGIHGPDSMRMDDLAMVVNVILEVALAEGKYASMVTDSDPMIIEDKFAWFHQDD